MNMNTTASMERTSTALKGKCEQTIKNMKRLMAEAGCAKYDVIPVAIPNVPGSKDDVVFVGLNGVGFHVLRGQSVYMPAPLHEILKNAGEL